MVQKGWLVLWALVAATASHESVRDVRHESGTVGNHDAAQCANYLCPAFPEAAKRYIENGCGASFSATDLAAHAQTRGSFGVAAVSSVLAALVGYSVAARSFRDPRGYLPVKGAPDDDILS